MNGEGDVGKGSVGSIDISSRVDPTGVMPPVDSGPAVESYDISEAQAEWKKMTIDDESYKDLPRSVFLKRRDDLFKRGFGEKLTNEKKTREEESRKFLENENEKFEDRDDKEALAKAQHDLELYFGGEKEANAAVKTAQSVVKRFATNSDIAFLNSSQLGNDPEFIEKLAEIGQILQRGGKKKK